jgi:hypothetical protein
LNYRLINYQPTEVLRARGALLARLLRADSADRIIIQVRYFKTQLAAADL